MTRCQRPCFMSDGLLLIGATGLVGSHVLDQAAGREIGILARRKPGHLSANIRAHIAESNDDWPNAISAFSPDCLICCIGTTVKKAGSSQQFRAVDHDLVIACAQAARDAGTRQMIVITAVGTNDGAKGLYLSTKAGVERALSQMGFDRLDIIRPSLLRGKRNESRFAESIWQRFALPLDRLMHGRMRKFRSISAKDVASAIWTLTGATQKGRFIHHFDELMRLAG